MKSRVKSRKVKVERQSLEELLQDNKEYIALLEKEHGRKAVEDFIEQLSRELNQAPKDGTLIEMPIVELEKE